MKETEEREEAPFTSQGIDDIDITIVENDASARAEVGIELVGSVEDAVAKGRLAGFGGWEIAADAALYQFFAGGAA